MFLLLVLVTLLTWYLYRYYSSLKDYPPGPTPIPIIGNLLALHRSDEWEKKLAEWAQEYGDIHTIHMGMQKFVTLNSYETAYKYMVKEGDVFTNRLGGQFAKILRGGDYGIVDSDGYLWMEHRRFALKVFREFGLSKAQMEDRILNEVEYLFDKVDQEIKKNPDDINLEQYTDIAVGSVINAVVCGYRYTDGHEDEFYRLKSLVAQSNENFGNAFGIFLFFNADVLKLPFTGFLETYVKGKFEEVIQNLHNIIRQHMTDNDYNNESMEPKDFIDAYLMEKFRLERNGQLDHTFTEQQLVNVCMDLWSAGQETTSLTLIWAIAYLIHNPEVQKKAHKELDRVVGQNRLVTIADRKDLHYINAIAQETQRCANIVSINLPRRTTEDIEIGGKNIKKGSIVIPQISVIMHDPTVFPEPHKFKPERFLDESGKFRQIEQMIPFSLGKRACLGEGLARMEMFLIPANLLNRYRFSAGKTVPVLKKRGGMLPKLNTYTCRIERRH